MFWGRLPFIVLAALLGGLIYWWGRELVGPAAALGALFLYAARSDDCGALRPGDHRYRPDGIHGVVPVRLVALYRAARLAAAWCCAAWPWARCWERNSRRFSCCRLRPSCWPPRSGGRSRRRLPERARGGAARRQSGTEQRVSLRQRQEVQAMSRRRQDRPPPRQRDATRRSLNS